MFFSLFLLIKKHNQNKKKFIIIDFIHRSLEEQWMIPKNSFIVTKCLSYVLIEIFLIERENNIYIYTE